MRITLSAIAGISPNDPERLEIELGVWFEVFVRQSVEGDVHMRYLSIRMINILVMMTKMIIIMSMVIILMVTMIVRATMPTWWSRMDHSDGWCLCCL